MERERAGAVAGESGACACTSGCIDTRAHAHGGEGEREGVRERWRETLRESGAAPSVPGTVGLNIKKKSAYCCISCFTFFLQNLIEITSNCGLFSS